MWMIASLAGGAAITYWLRETGAAIPAFLLLCVFILLLFVWPYGAGLMLAALLVISAIITVVALWQVIAGWILAVILVTLMALALLANNQPYQHNDASREVKWVPYEFHDWPCENPCE